MVRIEQVLTQRHLKKYLAELEDVAGLLRTSPVADRLEGVDALRVQTCDRYCASTQNDSGDHVSKLHTTILPS